MRLSELFYGQYVTMQLLINGEAKEIERLKYMGQIGEARWLHFTNPKTGENHLVSPDQFPVHVWKMDGSLCQLKYHD